MPSSWNNPKAALAFLEDARRVNKGLVIGHMGTTWVGLASFCRALLDPKAEVPKTKGASRGARRGAAEALRACMKAMRRNRRPRIATFRPRASGPACSTART